MTRGQAFRRAVSLWGETRVEHVYLDRTGSAEVQLYPSSVLGVDRWHTLDRNGCPTCHSACRVAAGELERVREEMGNGRVSA